MTITPYLNMNGNAEEVMNFYKDILGGETEIMRWGEMPPNPKMPVDISLKNKIMHATLTINKNLKLYFSDSFNPNEKPDSSNIFLHIEFDSESDLRKVFKALSEEATINMPLEKTFWGALYGDFIDKYGTSWGLHFQYPE